MYYIYHIIHNNEQIEDNQLIAAYPYIITFVSHHRSGGKVTFI